MEGENPVVEQDRDEQLQIVTENDGGSDEGQANQDAHPQTDSCMATQRIEKIEPDGYAMSASVRPPPPTFVVEADTVFSTDARSQIAQNELQEPVRADPLPDNFGDEVSSYHRELLRYVLLYTQRPCDFLEQQIEYFRRKLAQQTITVVFQSPHPLCILLHRHRIALLLILLAIMQLVFCALDVQRHARSHASRAFRFTPLELRSGSTDISHPRVAEFAILSEGPDRCLFEPTPVRVLTEGKFIDAFFEHEMTMSGFYVVTAGPVDGDPVRFSVSALDDGGAWRVVGYHRNLLAFSGARRAGGRAALPVARGEAFVVDVRAATEWPWHTGRLAGDVATAGGMLVAGLAGCARMGRRVGRPALYGSFMAAAAAMATAAASFALRERPEEAAMWGVYAGVIGAGTAGLWAWERGLVVVVTGTGLALLAADVVCHAVLVGGGAQDATVPAGHAGLGGLMVGGGLMLWVLWRAQRAAARSLIADDMALYDAEWRQVRGEEGPAVARLEGVVAGIRAAGSEGEARQCTHIRVEGGRGTGRDGEVGLGCVLGSVWWARNVWSTLMFDMPHEGVARLPVSSLDQIYAQATCLHPILLGKVQEWAGRSGGMFARRDGGLVRWEEARGRREAEGAVKWGQVKAERRAIEKVIRCYGEDVSRLVDVCRQSVVFDTVAELAGCLEVVAADDEVEVVRVKNRLSLSDDGRGSAGFRNVSVNLRVKGAEARGLGVDTHVCEVQLLLAGFARLQEDVERHPRYLLFRDFQRPGPRATATTEWLEGRMAGGVEEEVTRMMLARAPSAFSDDAVTRAASFGRFSSAGSSGLPRAPSDLRPAPSTKGGGFTSLLGRALQPAPRTLADSSLGSSGVDVGSALRRLSLLQLSRKPRRNAAAPQDTSQAIERDDVVRALATLAFRRCTSSKSSRRGLDIVAAMESVSVSSVLFIRHPIEGACSKPVIRALILAFSLAGIALTSAMLFFRLAAASSFPVFRLTSLGTRAQQWQQPANHSLAAFGVAYFHCPVHARPDSVVDAGPTLTMHYKQPVSMTEVWIQTSNVSQGLDTVRFRVDGSHDGVSWHLVGGSSGIPHPFGKLQWSDSRFATPEARNARAMSAGATQLWTDLVRLTYMSINFLCLSGIAAYVRTTQGHLNNATLLGAGNLMTFAAWTAIAACQRVWGEPNVGLEFGLFAVLFGVCGVTFTFRQQASLPAGTAAVVWAAGTRWFVFSEVHGLPVMLDIVQLALLLVLSLLVLAWLIRFHILWASRRMIEADKRHYDALWAHVTATESEDLQGLERRCEGLRGRDSVVRQCYSPSIISGHRTAAGGQTQRVPIPDIQQIYAQATCLHPILLGKVQEWAGRSGGMFARRDGGLVRWEEARGRREAEGAVKWGQVKAERRAIEKVIRCYGEDVSRLVDVCRQSVVFDTVAELAGCLEVVAADDEVEVVRVKNRLSLSDDGRGSAGFRNVSVNLRVKGAEARGLGVDTHVCEVQLLLAGFARLQKAEGHKRYVRFRNVRGE